MSYVHDYILNKNDRKISYAEFMELCLYHPQYGYYMSNKEKVGPSGDFITSSNIADVYGKTIAGWYYKEANKHGLPAQICEIGAGNGRFAKAFIDEWSTITNEPLHYFLIDGSLNHLEKQKELLPITANIKQLSDVNQLPPFSGLIFSNELFDALPVHVIEKQESGIFEVMITVCEDKLIEEKIPLKNQRIADFVLQSKLSLANGQRIEIPLAMEEVISKIAKSLIRGLVLTVDYGYTNLEWAQPQRHSGSLRGYHGHQMVYNILQTPGKIDITTHIHFDSFIRIGEEHQLLMMNKWRQDEFLLHAGIFDQLQNHKDQNPFSEAGKRNRAIRSLIMSSGISQAFHVILQEKNI